MSSKKMCSRLKFIGQLYKFVLFCDVCVPFENHAVDVLLHQERHAESPFHSHHDLCTDSGGILIFQITGTHILHNLSAVQSFVLAAQSDSSPPLCIWLESSSS